VNFSEVKRQKEAQLFDRSNNLNDKLKLSEKLSCSANAAFGFPRATANAVE
jgi:hypothetical protein